MGLSGCWEELNRILRLKSLSSVIFSPLCLHTLRRKYVAEIGYIKIRRINVITIWLQVIYHTLHWGMHMVILCILCIWILCIIRYYPNYNQVFSITKSAYVYSYYLNHTNKFLKMKSHVTLHVAFVITEMMKYVKEL